MINIVSCEVPEVVDKDEEDGNGDNSNTNHEEDIPVDDNKHCQVLLARESPDIVLFSASFSTAAINTLHYTTLACHD